ncbi:MAG TPA: GGDEF domain-containing protein [Phycisphaerae bacterium]|nr:GGDEF domain-containing protein [Phycisphaerae bacterium]
MIDEPARQSRLVVIGECPELLRTVEQRFAQAEVVHCNSFLAAIAELAHRPARAVLASVDAASWRLPEALAGLRQVDGQTRIVLCCEPALEPFARQAGANDYVILPADGEELDQALHMPATDTAATLRALPLPKVARAAAGEELEGLAEVLGKLDEPAGRLLDRLCGLLRNVFGAEAVCIKTTESAGQAGPHLSEAVFTQPIEHEGKVLGRIMLGKTPGGYQAEQAERLARYGRLIAAVLVAAKHNRQWRLQALTDDLTSLPNRRYLMQFLPDLLPRAARNRFRVTVLIFDLDDFKGYNDQFGHIVGDELIRETGQLFRRHCRKHDVVTRYGGDEFCVVFWDADQPRVAGSKHPSSALEVLKRFCKALQRHEFPALGPSGRGRLTVSGGLASFPWDASDADELLRAADAALRQAKGAGKNRIYLVGSENGSSGERPNASPPPPETS